MSALATNPGLAVDMRVGEAILLRSSSGVDSEKIVLILEQKGGRKARLRIQASSSIKVEWPEKRGLQSNQK